MADRLKRINQRVEAARARGKELGQQLDGLEAAAGIAEPAQQHLSSAAMETARIRRRYFSVVDPATRQDLMRVCNKLDEQAAVIVQAEVDQQAARIEALKRNTYWAFGAGVTAVALVLGGFWLASTGGAIAGAAVAYFYGKHTEAQARVSREAALKEAEDLLAAMQEQLARFTAEPLTFSEAEIASGQSDWPLR